MASTPRKILLLFPGIGKILSTMSCSSLMYRTDNNENSYMGSATGSNIQLQATLMNHTAVVNTIASHVKLAAEINQNDDSAPYVMGETNSLSGGGSNGTSNVFGAALWVVDYTLWQAVQNIQRVHFHQSGTSPYAAWSPSTNPPRTNAPYYGNIMAAAAVGKDPNTSISYFDLGNSDERTSAYVLYEGSQVRRFVLLNMIEYRSDSGTPRANSTFTISVPLGVKGARIERLTAPGAEVLSGITFGGLSYDYGLNLGKPVVADAAATKERAKVTKSGTISITLQDSEGAILYVE
jgi:hypothetical protein